MFEREKVAQSSSNDLHNLDVDVYNQSDLEQAVSQQVIHKSCKIGERNVKTAANHICLDNFTCFQFLVNITVEDSNARIIYTLKCTEFYSTL